jgi:hypothetical protein
LWESLEMPSRQPLVLYNDNFCSAMELAMEPKWNGVRRDGPGDLVEAARVEDQQKRASAPAIEHYGEDHDPCRSA